MSIGAPSNPGTTLIQRIDAMLGTTLGQQARLVAGSGPFAIPQPGQSENPNALRDPAQRDPRETVEKASARGQQRATVDRTMRDLQLANLLGRAATSHGATQSAPTTLGYAARIILALLNNFPQSEGIIRSSTPLLESPAGTMSGRSAGAMPQSSNPATANVQQTWAQLASQLNQPGAMAARLATALAQSVQTSGLFYESHLALLAQGKTTAQALQQEPQGQLRLTSAPQNTARGAAAQGSGTAGSSAMPAAEGAARSSTAGPGQATSTSSSAAQPVAHVPVPGIDPQTQGLVRQQLEVLANQGFVWQGEAWPGARLEWEVQRHWPEESDKSVNDPDSDQWFTQLRVQLPRLGEVHARMQLSGDQLQLVLTSPDSARQLSLSLDALRKRLLSKGLHGSQLTVQAEPVSDDQPPVPSGDESGQQVTAAVNRTSR